VILSPYIQVIRFRKPQNLKVKSEKIGEREDVVDVHVMSS